MFHGRRAGTSQDEVHQRNLAVVSIQQQWVSGTYLRRSVEVRAMWKCVSAQRAGIVIVDGSDRKIALFGLFEAIFVALLFIALW